MIPPLQDVVGRAPPVAVAVVLGVNAIVFALCAVADPEDSTVWLERWGLTPRLFLAALDGPPQVVWLTPLTATFLHAGLLHLAGNAVYLWVFGRPLEERLGWQRFAVFYAVCGLAAALVHVAAAPTSFVPTIGASGAISGLLGAYAVSDPAGRLQLSARVRVPAIAFLFAWIGIQVASGLGSGGDGGEDVAWWAHVGGFVAGTGLAWSLQTRRPSRSGHGV